MSLVTISKVNYFYPDGDARRYILKDVSCTFERGSFYAILGESGSGKTTFLSLLGALDKPKSGKVLYEEQDIAAIGFESFRRNKIGIVFQAYNLIPYMTAVENIKVAMDNGQLTIDKADILQPVDKWAMKKQEDLESVP
ncbi:MAG: ATP-binding cassette domain-containing protein [Peptococcaceae bacterium]|nr:ATP-binding cassette domain-containing protein [Peptococcaceae bacterium]